MNPCSLNQFLDLLVSGFVAVTEVIGQFQHQLPSEYFISMHVRNVLEFGFHFGKNQGIRMQRL